MAANLGIIKSIVLNKLNEAYFNKKISKQADDLTADFIEIIKSSPMLQLEMRVFNNVETKYISNDGLATRYIDSLLKLFEGFDLNEFRAANDKLKGLMNENHGLKNDSVKLYNGIYNLIEQTLMKQDADVDILLESFTTVLEHIKSDNKLSIINESLNNSEALDEFILKIAIDKFNTKYSEILTEDDKKIVKTLATVGSVDKKVLFEDYKIKSLDILKKANIDDEHYSSIIESLNLMNFNEKEADNQIIKLYELHKDLL